MALAQKRTYGFWYQARGGAALDTVGSFSSGSLQVAVMWPPTPLRLHSSAYKPLLKRVPTKPQVRLTVSAGPFQSQSMVSHWARPESHITPGETMKPASETPLLESRSVADSLEGDAGSKQMSTPTWTSRADPPSPRMDW